MHKRFTFFIVSKQRLRQLAALTWYVGSFALLSKGESLLSEASVLRPGEMLPFYSGLFGILVGVIKAKYLFNESCKSNLQRIDNLSVPYIWSFFRPRFFIFLSIMVATGATLSRVAHGSYPWLIGVGIVDLSVGMALLVSSRLFWQKQAVSQR